MPVYKDLKIIDLLVSNFLNLKCKTILFICSPEQFIFLKKRFKDFILYTSLLNKQKAICKIYYIINTEKNNITGMFKNCYDFVSRLNKIFNIKRKIFFFFSDNYSVLNPNLFRKHNFELDYVNYIYRKKEKPEDRRKEKDIYSFGLQNNNFICISEKILENINKEINKDISFSEIINKYITEPSNFKFSNYENNCIFTLNTWDSYINILNYANSNDNFKNNSEIINILNKKYYLPQISYDNFDYQDDFDMESIDSKKYEAIQKEKNEKLIQAKKRVIKLLT